MSLSRKGKTVSLTLGVFILIGYLGWSYLYQSHPDVESSKTTFEGTVEGLVSKVSGTNSIKTGDYVQVSGLSTMDDPSVIILSGQVFCQMSRTVPIKEGKLTVKGRFIGYDDIMEEIKLDQCIIIENDN